MSGVADNAGRGRSSQRRVGKGSRSGGQFAPTQIADIPAAPSMSLDATAAVEWMRSGPGYRAEIAHPSGVTVGASVDPGQHRGNPGGWVWEARFTCAAAGMTRGTEIGYGHADTDAEARTSAETAIAGFDRFPEPADIAARIEEAAAVRRQQEENRRINEGRRAAQRAQHDADVANARTVAGSPRQYMGEWGCGFEGDGFAAGEMVHATVTARSGKSWTTYGRVVWSNEGGDFHIAVDADSQDDLAAIARAAR